MSLGGWVEAQEDADGLLFAVEDAFKATAYCFGDVLTVSPPREEMSGKLLDKHGIRNNPIATAKLVGLHFVPHY
jgi:hypothetical protein